MRTKRVSDSDILLKAFTVISREGFESFTLEQVSKATQLSPAALIKRFKTKKNLALLARNEKWDANLSHGKELLKSTEKGIAGLYTLVDLISKSVDSRRLGEHARWLGTEALSPQSKKKVSTYFATTRKIIETHVREGQDRGELVSSVSPSKLSENLEAFIQGVIFQYVFLYDQKPISIHLKERVEFFLQPWRAGTSLSA